MHLRGAETAVSPPPVARQRPLRVALVTPEFGGHGGTTTVTRWLYNSLAEDDAFEPFVVSVATSSRDEASVRVLAPQTWLSKPAAIRRNIDGIECTHVGAWGCELEMRRYRPRALLDRLLGTADVVQIVAGSPAWGLLAARCRVPSVLQVATLSKWERESRAGSAGRGPMQSWRAVMTRVTGRLDIEGLKTVDKVMVENHRMYDLVAGLRPVDDVLFAPPGIDVDLFSPSPVSKKGGPILTVGRLSDPRKNVRGLLEAYARVRNHQRELPPLWLVGQDLRHSDRQALRALGIEDAVRVLPDLSQTELIGAYQTASVFVLPSTEEGFGLVILEAMACGLPVVATRCGGPETIVADGRTGLLVDVGDVDALAAAIGRLVQDASLAASLGREGRALAANDYSQARRAHQFLELYRSIARPHGRG